jgi:hypothetical protein
MRHEPSRRPGRRARGGRWSPRASALAVTYGLPSALVGGTAPFVDVLLVQRTGDPLGAAYYATAVTMAAAVGLLLVRETAFQPLDADPRFTSKG